jgi:hypothetical protein
MDFEAWQALAWVRAEYGFSGGGKVNFFDGGGIPLFQNGKLASLDNHYDVG